MFKLESYIAPLLMGYIDKYVKLRQEDFQVRGAAQPTVTVTVTVHISL